VHPQWWLPDSAVFKIMCNSVHVNLKSSAAFAFTCIMENWNCFFSHHNMRGILHLPLNMQGNYMLYGQYQSPQDVLP